MDNIINEIKNIDINDKIRASNLIQNFWKKKLLNVYTKKIFKKFIKWYPKLFGEPKELLITPYEKAAGFTKDKYIGAKNFQNYWGHVIEDIYSISIGYKKLAVNGNKGGNDGETNTSYYESKAKYNTMNAKLTEDCINPKLKYAIIENKKFYLLILVDKNNESRNIPLHKGVALSKIKNIDGYNELNHRWLSGDYIFKHLFYNNWKQVKNFIVDLLKYSSPL
tara:strand:+ start:113 stop:778 length:666 start_codon:yes stop_codon:yes gene_type:complete